MPNPPAQAAALGARLDHLEDQRALARLVHHYLESADSNEWDGWIESFTENAVFDLPNSFGLMRGRKEIYDVCVGKMHGTWASTQHMIVNTDFDLQGDTATGTANIVFGAIPAGATATEVYLMGGRYRWGFTRTPEGWRIADAWEEFIWNNGTELKSVFDPAEGEG